MTGVCGADENPKKRCILDAAARLFLERGFSATSMDAIAEAAPVSKPTLYNHFKDKNDLFAAVVQSRCSVLIYAMHEEMNEDVDFEVSLRNIARTFLDAVHSRDAICVHRIILSELAQFPDLGRLFYDSGPQKALALLSGYFQSLDRKGHLSIPDPSAAATLFVSMLKGDHHMRCLFGLRDHLTETEKKAVVESVVTFFLKGCRSARK